ncbi:hypothetical protein BH10BAC3_BH10BAC3_42150 [soil metagenome]
MFVTDVSQNKKLPIVVEPVATADYKKITKKQYSFNWRLEKESLVYKLTQTGQTDILGLMSIAYFDAVKRLQIRLLAVAKEHIGANKNIERIAGCLFAYAAKLAIMRYGAMAAMSLLPKTELGQHYMDQYGFEQAGRSLFIEGKLLLKLLRNYDYD